MRAVACQNPRVVDPVYHVILSWPAGERPTDDQAFACGEHAMASVGMAGHQYVFAIHRDTNNVHTHLAINRVHPVSFKAVYPSRDFYKLDRAMRELELRFGWQHDKGPFAVHDRGGIKVVDWAAPNRSSKGHMPSGARDMERHGDNESLFSYVRGRPRTLIAAALQDPALNWQTLHAIFGKFGLSLREKGRGLAVFEEKGAMSTTAGAPASACVKASDMHEELSKARLVRRLGAFESAISFEDAEERYDRFRAPVRDETRRAAGRQARADARRSLRMRFELERAANARSLPDPEEIRSRFRAVRAAAIRRRSEVRTHIKDRIQRKIQYSVIAFETARAIERLRVEVRVQREAVRAENRRSRNFREWVEGRAAEGDAAALAQLRGWAYAAHRRETQTAKAAERPGLRCPADGEPHLLPQLPGLTFKALRNGTARYSLDQDGGQLLYRDGFLEVESRQQDRRTLVAAALLATAAFGDGFTAEGDVPFQSAIQAIRAQWPTLIDLQRAWHSQIDEPAQDQFPSRRPGFTPDRN